MTEPNPTLVEEPTDPRPTTGKYSIKPYRCRKCGREEPHGTNHWGAIYPSCRGCGFRQTVMDCLEPCPPTHALPPEWTEVRLGDVADVAAWRPR